MGNAPDRGVLTPELSQAVGVVDVGRPLTSPLVEVGPGAGLNGEVRGRHLVFHFGVPILRQSATHVQGQCATALPGHGPEGGPARLPLPRSTQGAPTPYARGHFFGRLPIK